MCTSRPSARAPSSPPSSISPSSRLAWACAGGSLATPGPAKGQAPVNMGFSAFDSNVPLVKARYAAKSRVCAGPHSPRPHPPRAETQDGRLLGPFLPTVYVQTPFPPSTVKASSLSPTSVGVVAPSPLPSPPPALVPGRLSFCCSRSVPTPLPPSHGESDSFRSSPSIG